MPAQIANSERARIERGKLLAALLAGAWRRTGEAPTISDDELESISPMLLGSGTASLGWRRLGRRSSKKSDVIFKLQQASRLHLLQSALFERELAKAVEFFQSLAIDPLLGKGWAIARSYPEPGLRPYGDFDFYVRPEDFPIAATELKKPQAPANTVDLHCGATELNDRSFDQLYLRSQTVTLGDHRLRLFGAEDHLRLLCLHMLRHGAWRPLWLCDIGVAFESRPANFDWDYFLSGDRRRTDWVVCAIGLAGRLLGVVVENTPIEWRARHLPSWLTPIILRQWGQGQSPHGARIPMSHYLRHPAGLVSALKTRWPNPIEATVCVHGPFNELPRLPYQLGASIRRTVKFAWDLSRSRGER